MKSAKLMFIAVMTLLGALAIPLPLTAQNNQDHQRKYVADPPFCFRCLGHCIVSNGKLDGYCITGIYTTGL